MTTPMFSKTEEKILKILGNKKMTVTAVTKEFYKNAKKTIGPNNSIAGYIRRINEKCDFYTLEWFLNGEGLGRGGKTIWKEKREFTDSP